MGTQIPKKVPMGTRGPKWGPIGEQCFFKNNSYMKSFKATHFIQKRQDVTHQRKCGFQQNYYPIRSGRALQIDKQRVVQTFQTNGHLEMLSLNCYLA